MLRKFDWDDMRRKGWHLALLLGSAYGANNPKWSWAVPVLTMAAGVSQPPAAIPKPAAVGAIVLAAGLGFAGRLLLS